MSSDGSKIKIQGIALTYLLINIQWFNVVSELETEKMKAYLKLIWSNGPSTFVIFLKMYFLMVEHEHFVHTQVEYVLLENDSFYWIFFLATKLRSQVIKVCLRFLDSSIDYAGQLFVNTIVSPRRVRQNIQVIIYFMWMGFVDILLQIK